jgi:hypothetical protein
MVKNLAVEDDSELTEIPLNVIDTATLKRIVTWLEKWYE